MPPEDLCSVGVLDRPSPTQLLVEHPVPPLTAPAVLAPLPVVMTPLLDVAPVSSSRRGQPLAAAPSREQAAHCRDLLTEAASCDDPARAQRLRGEVIEAYLPTARSIAGRYTGRGVDRGDLEQMACIGLVKAARRWQPGRSEDFLQYAVPTMVGEIKRYFRDHSNMVRPTRSVQEARALIRDAQHDHWQRHGADPTDRHLSQATGLALADVREARAAGGVCRPSSLDEPDSSKSLISETHGHDDPRLVDIDNRVTVARLLQSLTVRERQVVYLRFEQQWSQTQIGAELGVSQMQVSRWLKVITRKLRDTATS